MIPGLVGSTGGNWPSAWVMASVLDRCASNMRPHLSQAECAQCAAHFTFRSEGLARSGHQAHRGRVALGLQAQGRSSHQPPSSPVEDQTCRRQCLGTLLLAGLALSGG